MAESNFQQQRFELKYRIRDEVALAVRDFVQGYLIPDEFSEGKEDFSYPVHSVYLDSDDMYLYHTTLNSDKNRFKLRMRFYDDSPEKPIFFEIKRRMNRIIAKQRGGVKREAVPWILAGHLPEMEHLTSSNPKELIAIQDFSKLMSRLGAVPKAHVAYMREAWMSPYDNSARVTMDRSVKCEPELVTKLATYMDKPVSVFAEQVTLELKFTGRFPIWFRELVRVFGLVQCGAAKYVEGVTLSGQHNYVPGTTSAPARGDEEINWDDFASQERAV